MRQRGASSITAMGWGALLVGSVFSVLFPVVLFFVLQKYLFGGLVLCGIKA